MKALWLTVAGLGLLYLAIWGVGKTDDTKQIIQAPKVATPDYAGIATGDALTRVPGATFKVDSVVPKKVAGDDLHEVPLSDPSGGVGAEVTLIAEVDQKPVARLTYRVAPPNKKYLVSNQPLK